MGIWFAQRLSFEQIGQPTLFWHASCTIHGMRNQLLALLLAATSWSYGAEPGATSQPVTPAEAGAAAKSEVERTREAALSSVTAPIRNERSTPVGGSTATVGATTQPTTTAVRPGGDAPINENGIGRETGDGSVNNDGVPRNSDGTIMVLPRYPIQVDGRREGQDNPQQNGPQDNGQAEQPTGQQPVRSEGSPPPAAPGVNAGPGQNASGPGSNSSGPGSNSAGPGSNAAGPGSNSSGPGSQAPSAGNSNSSSGGGINTGGTKK